MLKSDQPKKLTPHEKKLAEYKRIKAHAKNLLPFMLAATYPGVRERIGVAVKLNNVEEARAILIDSFQNMTVNCFALAEAFDKVSRQQKGKFLSVD